MTERHSSLRQITPVLLGALACWLWVPTPVNGAVSLSIGLLAPPDQADSVALRQGATIAMAHVNKTSQSPIRLAVRGRPGQWGTDGDEAAALALDDEVSGLITPSDGAAAHQVLQVAGRTGVTVVSLCSDSSITGAGVPWAVRIVPRTDQEAGAIFRALGFPAQAKATSHWAALVPPGRAGREVAKDLRVAANVTGCSLEEAIQIQPDSPAWAARLKAVVESRPDGLLLWTDPATAGTLAQQLRTAGFQGQLAGPARLCSPLFLHAAGTAAEGFVLPALAPDPASGGEQAQLEADYRKQFGAAPDFCALMAHDAVLLLAALLNDSRQSGRETRFPLLHAVPGASGILEFDRQGNRVVSLCLLVCKKGRFESYPGAVATSPRAPERSL